MTVPGRLFRMLLLRTLLEQIYVSWLVLKHRVQVVHGTHYALLASFGARRVTFHDMAFFTMTEVHTRGKVVYCQWFMRASMRLADQLIFVSRSAMEYRSGDRGDGRTAAFARAARRVAAARTAAGRAIHVGTHRSHDAREAYAASMRGDTQRGKSVQTAH